MVYMFLIEKKGSEGGSEVLLSQFGMRLRDESDFPSSYPALCGK